MVYDIVTNTSQNCATNFPVSSGTSNDYIGTQFICFVHNTFSRAFGFNWFSLAINLKIKKGNL